MEIVAGPGQSPAIFLLHTFRLTYKIILIKVFKLLGGYSMKKLISALLMVVTIFTSVFSTSSMIVMADESKVLTLGANLTEEQKQLVIDYLGVDISQVVVIEVNNEDEHALLDGIATQQQIGTRTFSCSYIEPTSFGGIHIKTVNLSWVTCEMIRNALVTSGITNCNIICMSPIEVSGTGALTGIFKAYENISGVELTDSAKELASEELIATCEIAGTIGQEEASSMMSELKEEIITSELSSSEEIEETVRKYIESHNIELTEDDIWKLLDILIKISKQDYNIEEVKQAYADIKQTASEVKEATEKTVGFFEGIWNWLKGAWNWLTGKADEVKESEELQAIKDSMGILAQTNDSLLGTDTVVTNTIEDDVLDKVSEDNNDDESANDSDKKHWYQFIIDLLNSGNSDTNNEEQVEEETQTEESITFDDFKDDAEEYQEELDSIEESAEEGSASESGLLQYIQSDFDNTSEDNQESEAEQDKATNTEVSSFDELTN